MRVVKHSQHEKRRTKRRTKRSSGNPKELAQSQSTNAREPRSKKSNNGDDTDNNNNDNNDNNRSVRLHGSGLIPLVSLHRQENDEQSLVHAYAHTGTHSITLALSFVGWFCFHHCSVHRHRSFPPMFLLDLSLLTFWRPQRLPGAQQTTLTHPPKHNLWSNSILILDRQV